MSDNAWDRPDGEWFDNQGALSARHVGPRVTRKDEPFPHVHYSDKWWDEARTIYGKERKGLFYNYDDRLQQWDWKKHEAAAKAAGDGRATVAWWERYLTHYHGYEVKIEHVLAGTNRASGYAYYCFGYNPAQEARP